MKKYYTLDRETETRIVQVFSPADNNNEPVESGKQYLHVKECNTKILFKGKWCDLLACITDELIVSEKVAEIIKDSNLEADTNIYPISIFDEKGVKIADYFYVHFVNFFQEVLSKEHTEFKYLISDPEIPQRAITPVIDSKLIGEDDLIHDLYAKYICSEELKNKIEACKATNFKFTLIETV